VSKPGSDEVPK